MNKMYFCYFMQLLNYFFAHITAGCTVSVKTCLKLLAVCWIFSLATVSLSLAQEIDESQEAGIFTLYDIVELALDKSPAAFQAQTRRENRYWQWRTYRSDYMPRLSLQGNLPNYMRSNTSVIQPDGSIEYRPVNQNQSTLNLFAEQSIGWTNTSIFVNSELQRFDNFEEDRTIYSGNPAVVGIRQPLFRFNPLKWNRIIEPLRYEESKREYVEDQEEIAINATERFFRVLLAQINLATAQRNLANNDTIYQIAQGRYNLGKIAENELLMLELNLMNSRQDVAQAQLDMETSTLRLKSFIGYTNTQPVRLLIPDELPAFEVDENQAVREALQNRQEAIALDRRLKQAERNVAQARGDNGLNIDLYATYGLTDRSNYLSGVYNNPENQQRVNIGFSIPILDWGRSRSRIKTAEAYLELEQYTVQQDKINFEQEVYTQVKTFEMLHNQVKITEVADDIADRSYEIAKQRYLIGKISITDLNIALQEKDKARGQYVESLGNFWNAYYELRRMTLYDFEDDQPLYNPQDNLER